METRATVRNRKSHKKTEAYSQVSSETVVKDCAPDCDCGWKQHNEAQLTNRANESDAKKPEQSKLMKFVVRMVSSIAMLTTMAAVLYAGHVVVCATLILLQALVFRELVNLRYIEAKEKEMPYFRSLQWAWYAVAAVYAHGSTWLKAPMGVDTTVLLTMQQQVVDLGFTSSDSLFALFSFGLFSVVFMASVLSLREGLYEYQISQFSWTLMCVLLVVVQMKTMVYNVYQGMFWFLFPFLLVISNDSFAYFAGMSLGKKVFPFAFLKLSPNKTWEGFMGGVLGTCALAYFAAPLMGSYPAMRCSYSELRAALPGVPASCHNDHLFLSESSRLKTLGGPGVHPEIQLHALGLGLFVSLVAPFGGFLASAIKRATNIKDFDSVIPGHGGFTDRLDCQFVMFIFTYLYYSTFVASPTSSSTFAAVLVSAHALPASQQCELIMALGYKCV